MDEISIAGMHWRCKVKPDLLKVDKLNPRSVNLCSPASDGYTNTYKLHGGERALFIFIVCVPGFKGYDCSSQEFLNMS